MSKINIYFNGTDYQIEESALSAATAALKSHLSTVMNGSGAVINFGGIPYNVDSTKLSSATSDFVAHLSTINGTGSKVKVNGVEYSIDSTKLDGAISGLQTAWGNLNNPGGGSDKLTAGLYQNGVMVKSWDELVSEGIISVENSCVMSADKSIDGDLVGSDDITSIGYSAFYNCDNLTTVDFPNVTTIGNDAFTNCNALTTADFPLATTIGDDAFYNCDYLTTVNFPKVTFIGDTVFRYCNALTTADFPKATTIGEFAFGKCSALTTLILSSPTMCDMYISAIWGTKILTEENSITDEGFIYVPTALYESYVADLVPKAIAFAAAYGMTMDEPTATYMITAILRKLEDYTVDGTTTGALDESKI